MPVSSPTYFPPAGSGGQIVGATAGSGATGIRTFLAGLNAGKFTQPINDLIVIGHNAFAGGTLAAPIVDQTYIGVTVLGSGAAASVNSSGALIAGLGLGTSTIIGFLALPLDIQTNYNTIVGAQILANWVSNNGNAAAANVLLGDAVGAFVTAPPVGFGVGFRSNVILGWKAGSAFATASNQAKSVHDNVVIGSQAMKNLQGTGGTGGPGVGFNVVIGATAGQNFGSIDNATGCQANIAIGYSAGGADRGDCGGNVLIGNGAVASGGATTATRNVGIGSTLTGGFGVVAGLDRNVVIGADAANLTTNSRCILIGGGAGAGIIGALNDQLLIETFDTVTRRGYIYGIGGNAAALVAPSGLILGASTPGTDRDIPGTNLVKLLNGTVTGVAPVGGGFFYCIGGDLHYVDTANNDVKLSRAAGQLAATAAAYTNNAAAAAGTLTNAPVAGNPTKWIPINDNGTIRNVPAW